MSEREKDRESERERKGDIGKDLSSAFSDPSEFWFVFSSEPSHSKCPTLRNLNGSFFQTLIVSFCRKKQYLIISAFKKLNLEKDRTGTNFVHVFGKSLSYL